MLPGPIPRRPPPPRFLPEYDNVLLSHADRRRFASDATRNRVFTAAGPVRGTVLYDGGGLATWWIDRDRAAGTASLVIRHVGRLTKQAAGAVAEEGTAFLRFVEAGADRHDVRLVRLD